MRIKKKTEPEKSPEQEALEKRVDAMMDPKAPDNSPAEITPKPAAVKPKPVIEAVTVPVSDSPTTAPQLPKPGKKITITDVPSEPLSIDKLDELAESIVSSKSSAKSKKSGKPAKSKKAAEPKEQDELEEAEEPGQTETPEAESPQSEEAVSQDDVTGQSTELEDPQTDKAVDDIVAYEGDVMLAVADSTAAEHSREFSEPETEEHHHVFSTLIWTLVALVAILIIVLTLLLVMGDSLTTKLGL